MDCLCRRRRHFGKYGLQYACRDKRECYTFKYRLTQYRRSAGVWAGQIPDMWRNGKYETGVLHSDLCNSESTVCDMHVEEGV